MTDAPSRGLPESLLGLLDYGKNHDDHDYFGQYEKKKNAFIQHCSPKKHFVSENKKKKKVKAENVLMENNGQIFIQLFCDFYKTSNIYF